MASDWPSGVMTATWAEDTTSFVTLWARAEPRLISRSPVSFHSWFFNLLVFQELVGYRPGRLGESLPAHGQDPDCLAPGG